MLSAVVLLTIAASIFSSFAPLRLCVQNNSVDTRNRPVEVFQVLELPLNVHEALLVRSEKEKGYLLKLSLANSTGLKMTGFRYSLVSIDAKHQPQFIANRTEGFSLAAYSTQSLSFKIPLKFKPKDGERLVLMLEQVISHESIWEVVKAKEAFEAYARGDYSVMPSVLRVANQVDAPLRPRVIYRNN